MITASREQFMNKYLCFFILIFANAAFAENVEKDCAVNQMDLIITNMGTEKTFSAIKVIYDKNVAMAIEITKKSGIKNPEIKSETFNVISREGVLTYDLAIGIKMESLDKAVELAEQLRKKGIEASINRYRYNNCANSN